MTLKLNGTNSEAAPAYAGDDADTGLQCGTNELKLVTGGSARVTVNSSGNLGIGLTNPAAQLAVQQGTDNALNVAVFTGGDALRGLKLGTKTYNGLNDGGVVYNAQTGGTSGSHHFQVNNGVDAVKIDQDGLKFGSDTASTNALDDYEEGTFDAFANVAGNFTGESTGCSRYTRIGNLVYVDLRLLWTGTVGGSTGIQFDLPFAQAGTSQPSNGHTGIVFYAGTSVDSSAISSHIPKGGSKVSFYRTDGGSFSTVSRSSVNGSYDWIVSFSYFVG